MGIIGYIFITVSPYKPLTNAIDMIEALDFVCISLPSTTEKQCKISFKL